LGGGASSPPAGGASLPPAAPPPIELPIEPLIPLPFLQINFPRGVVPQVPSTLSPLALLYVQASPGDLPEQAARRAWRVAFAASASIAGASAAQAKKATAISNFRLIVLSFNRLRR
jgi:hypothetical protein